MINRVPANAYFVPVELGTTVYFVLHYRFIISAKVVEIQNIWSVDNGNPIWENLSLEAEGYSEQQEDSVSGEFKFNKVGIPSSAKWVNQILWIDEPVGHGVQIGDEVFLTVQEARNSLSQPRPKYKYGAWRKVKQWRRNSMDFIASTHGVTRQKLDWPAYPNKSVYV